MMSFPFSYSSLQDKSISSFQLMPYDQVEVGPNVVGDLMDFIPENTEVTIRFYQGYPVIIEPPRTIILSVTDIKPGTRGFGIIGDYISAQVETGAQIIAAPNVNVGDRIEIDTTKRQYLGKV